MKTTTVRGARMKIFLLLHSSEGLPCNCIGFTILPMVPVTAGGLKLVPCNFAHNAFGKNGFHSLIKHYYLPIPENTDLNWAFYERRSELVGLEVNCLTASCEAIQGFLTCVVTGNCIRSWRNLFSYL